MHQNTSFLHPFPYSTPQVPPLQLDPGYATTWSHVLKMTILTD